MHIVHGQLKKEDGTLVRESILFSETEEEGSEKMEEVREFLEGDGDAAAEVKIYSPDEIKDFLETVTPQIRFESGSPDDDEEE